MELNAETRSVNQILSPNKKYIVPRFQREYSWKEEEIDEFWDDIVQQIKADNGQLLPSEYFIGCIVLVGEESKASYQIVDGQQRLTTLTVLLRCIISRLKELNDDAAANALYANVIEGTDNDGNRYFKLVNETPKPFFQNELQSINPQHISKAKTMEEKLLQGANTRLKKKIESYKPKGFSELDSVKAVREQVLNNLKVILVTAKQEDDAYTIFETLNARGISLTSVDLIKNWIFKNYNDLHPNDNAKDVWGQIRQDITKFSDLETFFRHYWNSKYAFASNDRLYKSFKDQLRRGRISCARTFLLELKSAASRYQKIGQPSEADWPVQKEKEIGRSLALVNHYRVTQVRPFLLALLEAREQRNINQTEMVSIVKNIEQFHFVFSSLCQERASGLEGTYTRAAKQLYVAGSDKTKVLKAIKVLNSALLRKKPNQQKINSALLGLSLSDGNDSSKRLIQTTYRKIEQHLLKTSELIPGNFSIEHVSDQSNGQNWMNRLGNLLPLDEVINNGIKAGLSFEHKKLHYAKSKLRVVQHFLSCNPQQTWEETDAKRWFSEVSNQLFNATELKQI
jgi:hypothetical protein